MPVVEEAKVAEFSLKELDGKRRYVEPRFGSEHGIAE